MTAPGDIQRGPGGLRLEQVDLARLAADHGTPCYVYSRAALENAWRQFDGAMATLPVPHRVHYAVKANANLAVLAVLARLGAGFDIVSVGELQRVLRAGGDPAKVVFSGVGKAADEMAAALAAGIACFNVESSAELQVLSAVASARGDTAPVALRVNPDVDARTHPYISTGLKNNKFGVPMADARALYRQAADLPGIRVVGLASHIGSQVLDTAPFADSLDRLLELAGQLAADGLPVAHLDVGGGLGVRYQDEQPPTPADLAAALAAGLARQPLPEGCQLWFEPGRYVAANAGLLLTRVHYLKHNGERGFAIIDAAMNDLLRPSLYQAWHQVEPVAQAPAADAVSGPWDLVGPVCESSDVLARDRHLDLAAGDLLAVLSAGAYGFGMSSNYNSRNRAAEVLVDGHQAHLVRRRETIDDQLRGEQVPMDLQA